MSHTPTPWSTTTEEIPDGKFVALTSEAGDIAYLTLKQPEVQANAAFIVRAVNSHEALVSALKAALAAEDKAITARNEDFDIPPKAWVTQAKEALEKAK